MKLSCQPYVYYICKQYAAARACSAQNSPTFLGRLWLDAVKDNVGYVSICSLHNEELTVKIDWKKIELTPVYTATPPVAASLLQACCLAVIQPISGCVRIACSGSTMITSLLRVVNRLDSS